uniref:Uncharacterized protein n=1 Tax=Setaria italica TaxID=4555 RepID=K4ANQ9_SETIT
MLKKKFFQRDFKLKMAIRIPACKCRLEKN